MFSPTKNSPSPVQPHQSRKASAASDKVLLLLYHAKPGIRTVIGMRASLVSFLFCLLLSEDYQ